MYLKTLERQFKHDLIEIARQKPKGSVIDSKIPESNNIGSQREMGNIIQTDQTNEYEQIIKGNFYWIKVEKRF